ncbi:MAG: hypothetical protein C0507_15545 [Cyanobacteria bacterium PR.3.49]|nr:hypothetical protein [Cyanobacteria bacterium PR.3.49]
MALAFAQAMESTPNRPFRIAGKDIRCFYPLFVLALMAAGILSLFWFGSRYPQLLLKANELGHHAVASFIWNSELIKISAGATLLEKIGGNFANWIWSMRIGMSFGLAMGALLHTVFEFYPPKLGKNIYLNTLKGIAIGAPAAVCVNCAVPIACGLTRGKANIESALSFMFSSPTLNFIVISMVLSAFPVYFAVIQYTLLAVLLFGLVPLIVYVMNRNAQTPEELELSVCALPLDLQDCKKTIWQATKEVLKQYGLNFWKLVKSAVPMMLAAALISSIAIEFIPFQAIFAHVTFGGLLLTALVTVFLPVPIALDVIVAQQLYSHGVPAPYVILFLFTLGTYSILPMTYLWQEVSKKLAVGLYFMFVALGLIAAYVVGFFV